MQYYALWVSPMSSSYSLGNCSGVNGLVYGFDSSYIVKHTLGEELGRSIPMHALLDSETVFNVGAKVTTTLGKRLQIDVNGIRQSHKYGELKTIGWIPGSSNPEDGLTCEKLPGESHPLQNILKTNNINSTWVVQWLKDPR